MRRRTAAIVAVGIVLAASQAPAGARSESPRRVTLGAVSSFTASMISGIPVRLPRAASFVPGVDSRHIRIAGGGRMAGYVLVQEGVGVRERVTLMTTVSRFCREPGCSTAEPFFWHSGTNVPWEEKTKVRTLPAGDYLLYVIADETEVTVTLRLDGLAGRRHFDLTRPADGAIVLPRVRSAGEASKTTYWFGEEASFSGSSGIAIPMIRFRTGHAVWNRREVCYYHRAPEVPDPVAYAPGCPAAEAGAAVQEHDHVEDQVVIDGYYSQVTGDSTWGFGMNYVVGGEVREADSLFLYVDVDPKEL